MNSHSSASPVSSTGPFRPHLVLAAGLLCDETVWAAVAERLAPYTASITIISFPGLDRIEAMADKLLAEAPFSFALAGHSMGGRVALEAIRQAPGRIERLALLNTGIHSTRAREAASRGALVDRGFELGMVEVARAWLPPMMATATDPAVFQQLQAMVVRQTPASFAAQTQALLNRPEAAQVLGQVGVPTLLVSADQDAWSPVAQHEQMLLLRPEAQLKVIQGAGHMAPAEAPAAVAEAMLGWLSNAR